MKLISTVGPLLALAVTTSAQGQGQTRVLNLRGIQPARTIACGSLLLLWLTNQPYQITAILEPTQTTTAPSVSEASCCKVKALYGADIVGFAVLTGSEEALNRPPSKTVPARFRLRFEAVESAAKAACVLQPTESSPSPLQPELTKLRHHGGSLACEAVVPTGHAQE